jgi:dihydroflavonol-4-reductase
MTTIIFENINFFPDGHLGRDGIAEAAQARMDRNFWVRALGYRALQRIGSSLVGDSILTSADTDRGPSGRLGRTCLVTGGTGLLGINLVRCLVAQGWNVTVLSQRADNAKFLSDLPITYICGDIADPEHIDRATAGQEVVFHVAGDTSWWKKQYPRQWRTNVDGAVNVIESARRNGVRRVVHTSTVDTIGYNPKGVADENWPIFNFNRLNYHYAISKREGERRALAFNGNGIEVVVIQPASMMGPYDVNLQYGRLFADLRDGKMAAVPCGGVSFNHVVEVAKAHVTAADLGVPGERYICAGEQVSYRRLFDVIARKISARAPRITVPPWVLIAYGWIDETIAGFTNVAPQMNPGMAFYMSCNAFYSSDKAIANLGYKITPFEEAVDDTHRFLLDNGFLNKA